MMLGDQPATRSSEQLHGSRKVAALLMVMGKPHADRVLRHFSEAELLCVLETAGKLGSVARADVEGFAAEMHAVFEQGADVRVSPADIDQLLVGVIPNDRLTALLGDIRGGQQPSVWTRLSALPDKVLHQYLVQEHPQIAAIILSRTLPNIAAAVLCLMPTSVRAGIIRRILSLRPVPDAAISLVEAGLQEGLFGKSMQETNEARHERAADILNRMEREQKDEVLGQIARQNPADAELLQALMFSFEDIGRLSQADLTKLFNSVPVDRIVVALRGAPAELCGLVLASVGARSRRMIEQELGTSTELPARDITNARRVVADLALELAKQGHIQIKATGHVEPAGRG